MAARVQQRLREMACVAYLLRNRERMKELLDAGDHAAFRQQAVQFFGAAPADVDPQDYILKLEADFRTQKNFFERLNKAPTVTVQGMPISGRWDSRRARQRKNFLFLAKEGADENFHSFATAFPEYFDPDGDLKPGPHNQLFYDFAEWTMREHPDWTLISHIDDHCGRKEPWEPPVHMIVAVVVFAAVVVFYRALERVQTIRGFPKMSQARYDAVIQMSIDLLGPAVVYGMLAGVWWYAYQTTGRTKECFMWLHLIFLDLAVSLFGVVAMAVLETLM